MSDIDLKEGMPDTKIPAGEKGEKKWDRLLPPEGVRIVRNNRTFDLQDGNDVSPLMIEAIRESMVGDPDIYAKDDHIIRGKERGRRFRIYASMDSLLLGLFSFREFFDSPDGFKAGDFLYGKYIMSEYRKTRELRVVSGIVLHLVLRSGHIRRLYSYLAADPDHKNKNHLAKFDPAKTPCMNPVFSYDDSAMQPYMKMEKTVETVKGTHVIIEISAADFNAMDHKKYYSRGISLWTNKPDADQAVLDRVDSLTAELDKIIGKLRKP